MNEFIIPLIVFAFAGGWIFVLIRHCYLIRVPFQKHMARKHPEAWEAMKNDNSWTATWVHPYYSQAVYNFIWRSSDNLNDPIVEEFKNRIRKSGWHIPLYFFFIACSGVLLSILSGKQL